MINGPVLPVTAAGCHTTRTPPSRSLASHASVRTADAEPPAGARRCDRPRRGEGRRATFGPPAAAVGCSATRTPPGRGLGIRRRRPRQGERGARLRTPPPPPPPSTPPPHRSTRDRSPPSPPAAAAGATRSRPRTPDSDAAAPQLGSSARGRCKAVYKLYCNRDLIRFVDAMNAQVGITYPTLPISMR